jgi:hypothetical protein
MLLPQFVINPEEESEIAEEVPIHMMCSRHGVTIHATYWSLVALQQLAGIATSSLTTAFRSCRGLKAITSHA